MFSSVIIILLQILNRKEVLKMLVRLYASEIILEKITINDVPNKLKDKVSAYLEELGY